MKRIYFIHIAKTGGISVEENLIKETSMVPCPAYYWEDLLKLENSAEYNLFIGHLQYFCKDIIGDAFRFTILRDPVERAMSGWEHISRDTSHPLNASLSEAPDIKSALTHRVLQRHISNSMTRFLGYRAEFSKFKSKEAAIKHALQCTPDRQMLENAKECLKELDFIGFTETLNPDLLKLFKILGIEQKAEKDLIVKNSNPLKQSKSYRDSLSNESLELLTSANALDYELYEYAKQIADEKGWA